MSDSDLDLDEFLDTVDTEDAMMDAIHAPAAPGPVNAAVANVYSIDVMALGSSDQGKKKEFRSRRNSGSAASSSNSVGVAGNAKFPVKLHDMLTQTNVSGGIIEWRQDGTCFKILDRERLATELLPMYFDHNNYTSFSRQLNGWGFKRLKARKCKAPSDQPSSSVEGCYYHELFHAHRPEGASKMKRSIASDKSGKSSASSGGGRVITSQGSRDGVSGDDQTMATCMTSSSRMGGGGLKDLAQSPMRRGALAPVSPASISSPGISPPKRASFPVKLHAILSRPDLSDVIQWCDHGGAFRVIRPKEFAADVLPCYFDHSNYSSFLRKVRGWRFRRVKTGEEAGSYYHEDGLFHRDKPYLALRMKRQSKASCGHGGSQSSVAISSHRINTNPQSDMNGYSLSPLLVPNSNGEVNSKSQNDGVMESLIQMQKILNEQQELLRKQILEIGSSPVESSEHNAGAPALDQAHSGMLSEDMMCASSDDESGSSGSRKSRNSNSNGALYSYELSQLEKAVDCMPASNKAAYTEAQKRCPDIVNDADLKVRFLWCTDFDAEKSALKMVKYWQLRVELFGPEKAFQPINANSNLDEEDRQELLTGSIRMLPHTDAYGRTIFYISQRRLHSRPRAFDPKRAARVVWYQIHTILQDPERAKKGIIGVNNFKDSSWAPNYAWATIMSDTFKYSPVEIKGLHVCHAGLFARILAPLIPWVVGPWVRNNTFALHAHNDDVATSLSRFGLSTEILPTEIGGDVQM